MHQIGVIVKNKIKYILNNNSDFKTILNTSEIFGKETSKDGLPDELTTDDFHYVRRC